MEQSKLSLPTKIENNFLQSITTALKLQREVLASEIEIEEAWRQLPRYLSKVPDNYKNAMLAKMCVAIKTGLFDSALNYIWNLGITALRSKVDTFGFTAVSGLLEKDIDEKKLLEWKDHDLLDLCLKINLINEDAFFFLNNCRELRNQYSIAHPNEVLIDDAELIAFLNRVIKYAIGGETNPKGIDLRELLELIRANQFSSDQLSQWTERFEGTHEAQRQAIFQTLHAIYCDPKENEVSRGNVQDLSLKCSGNISSNVLSGLADRHGEYLAKGDEKRIRASRKFFEELGLTSALSNAEQSTIFSKAVDDLNSIHNGYDNFHNEPPFADRLSELKKQLEVPDHLKDKYVTTVISCFIGNGYGVSRKAEPIYESMISNFTWAEIKIMLQIAEKSDNIVGFRVKEKEMCKSRFKQACVKIDSKRVTNEVKILYDKWI
ncbi:hypothetical protein MRY82_04740 [bacterium]|nr:hypothetical protein [bacterium]